jgi:Zn2+/Cd2+-exporting ATPase
MHPLFGPSVHGVLTIFCTADVGVAMGEGAALSMETADITLLDSDLRKIEYGIRMGRRVSHKISQNIVFSIVSKAVVLVFALLGKAELWAAIAADVGAMLVVTLNAMTLLPNRSGSDGQRKHPTGSPHGTYTNA